MQLKEQVTETLLVESVNGTTTISFNRPERMNAFNTQMAIDLEKVTESLRHDKSLRVLLLKGTGKMFMPGGDILEFHEHVDELEQGVRSTIRTLNGAIANLAKLQVPIVAAVHGSVAGVGMSFMATADLVLAMEGTKFTTAYSGLGVSPDGGLSFSLPHLVGLRKALELALLGEVIDAEEAKKIGLINWVVPAEGFEKKAQEIVQRLAAGPTTALAWTRKLVREGSQGTLLGQLDQEAEGFSKCTGTADFKEGVKSFLEKRRPAFIGK